MSRTAAARHNRNSDMSNRGPEVRLRPLGSAGPVRPAAHEAYALSAMLRKKYDVAISEFKQSIEGAATPDPATMVRLGQAYNLAGKYDDAIAILDKVMAGADVHPQIKQFAQAERVRAIQAKGAGAKPPAPPADPKK